MGYDQILFLYVKMRKIRSIVKALDGMVLTIYMRLSTLVFLICGNCCRDLSKKVLIVSPFLHCGGHLVSLAQSSNHVFAPTR